MAPELDDLRRRLEAVDEELGDLIIEHLRESVESQGAAAPGQDAYEKRLRRARRAVERALAILGEDRS